MAATLLLPKDKPPFVISVE